MEAAGETPIPDFSNDPHGWFTWIGGQVGGDEWPAVLGDVPLADWVGDHGNAWRVMRSTHGIEVRPSLISPFIRFGDAPRVTAIALGTELEVELTCREMRWIDRFGLDSFDVASLGHTMLQERELPHDNLPRLFPGRTHLTGP